MKKILISILALTVLVSSSSAQTPKHIVQALKKGKPGQIVLLKNFLTEDLKKVNYAKNVAPGPQFIISDDPEYIRIPEAIVMQENVLAGAVRLYVYNVNGVLEPQKMPRKINTVLKNLGKEDLHLRMMKYSSQKPSTNYFQIGKQGLEDFFRSDVVGEVRIVKPGEVVPLDPRLENQVVLYDELVHGFYEFVIDQPAQLSVVQTSPEKSTVQAFADIDTIIPFSHVNAGRGIFPFSNYKVVTDTVDTKNGVSQIIMADGKDDPWITGTIGADQQPAKNAGNYGVLYDTNIKWKSTDGKAMALVTWNSRSDNQWCGGMGLTMELFDAKGNKAVRQMPSERLVTKSAPEAILIGIYKPDPNREIQEIRLTYSPPGASCLPTPLILIPIDL
ncbi:copper amine oxidase [Arcticibacter sp.]|uniref:copper amine oxidase n=1 Tax=Arcticibacter sp. TaxID=1872630 RepID=UPI00388DBB49